jgi:peptidyl-prolyl cis-trans isomerase C
MLARKFAILSMGFCLLGSITLTAQDAPAKKELPPATKLEQLPTPVRPQGVAAKVNGADLPEVAVARALMGVDKTKRAEARVEIMGFLIDNVLVDQYLAYQKIEVDQKDVTAQLEEFKNEVKKAKQEYTKVLGNLMLTEEELTDQISAQLRWEKFLTKQAPEANLKAFFDANVEMFDGSLVRARHILITPKNDPAAKAEATKQLTDIKTKIEAETVAEMAKLPADTDNLAKEQKRTKFVEDSFASNAKAKSACPSAKEGGDLNWFPRFGTMVEPFAKAAFALKPSQMSEVVTTDFGVHLILVTARKPGQATKFEDVKEAVKEVYGGKVREKIVEMMRKQAKIEVTPVAN